MRPGESSEGARKGREPSALGLRPENKKQKKNNQKTKKQNQRKQGIQPGKKTAGCSGEAWGKKQFEGGFDLR